MLLIRNARLFTMEGDGYIEGGDVLMEAGKVVAAGANLSAPGAKVIDAHGATRPPASSIPTRTSASGRTASAMTLATAMRRPIPSPRSCGRWTRSTPSIPALPKPAAPA